MGNCPGREAKPAFRTGDWSGKTYRSNGSRQKREVWVEQKVPGDVLPWSLMTLPVHSQWKREASVEEDRDSLKKICVLHRGGPYLLAQQWSAAKQTVAWRWELGVEERHGVP